jgi:hypothetical protein
MEPTNLLLLNFGVGHRLAKTVVNPSHAAARNQEVTK